MRSPPRPLPSRSLRFSRFPARAPRIASPAAALALALALASCGATPPPAPKLSAIQAAVFTPSCTFSSCHSSAGNAGGLVLEAGASWANLVNVAAQQTEAAQGGLLRVKPGDPADSFLIKKLQPGLPLGYGDHMPDTGQQLEQGDLDAISTWISMGANDD